MERLEKLRILRQDTDAPIHLCLKALDQTDSLLAARRWLKENGSYVPLDKRIRRLNSATLLTGRYVGFVHPYAAVWEAHLRIIGHPEAAAYVSCWPSPTDELRR